MWEKLNHPEHADFFRELQRHRAKLGDEDWSPIVRLAEHLRTTKRAEELFAFSSHATLNITTCPAYGDEGEHHRVGISWDPWAGEFRIDYAPMKLGWIELHDPLQVAEQELYGVVDTYLERLIARPAGS